MKLNLGALLNFNSLVSGPTSLRNLKLIQSIIVSIPIFPNPPGIIKPSTFFSFELSISFLLVSSLFVSISRQSIHSYFTVVFIFMLA